MSHRSESESVRGRSALWQTASILILYDNKFHGIGHQRRSEFLISRFRKLGYTALGLALEGDVGADPQSLISNVGVLGSPFPPTHIVVDSYKPRDFISSFLGQLGNPPVLQLVDHRNQSLWASHFIDPFSTMRDDQHAHQGLEYAIVGIESGSPRWNPSDTSDRTMVAVGSSDASFVHALMSKWPNLKLEVVSRSPLHLQSENLQQIWLDDQRDFIDKLRTAKFVISNCGVTGLQRLALGVPGVSLVTEENQIDAGIAMEKLGAKVYRDTETLLMELSISPEQALPAARIGISLDEALLAFVESHGSYSER